MNLKEFKKVKKEFMKNSQQVIANEFKEFFEKYPEIDAVRWNQYTPHFNDGDVCEFARYDFHVKVVTKKAKAGEVGDEELISGTKTDDDGYYQSWDVDAKTPLGKALNELEETFDHNTYDVFNSAFGDGYQIVATRKGFKVEDYDHD